MGKQEDIKQFTKELEKLKFDGMYENDFFLTWEKSRDELDAVFNVANALRNLRERNISTKIFDSGLGVSLFRDNSTRTRFSFASACNLLGLEVQDLDEGKSQVAHGETVRETANMISFMADVIGIRDDMYIGKGNSYMHEVVDSVRQGHIDGVLEQKPTLVNLQCDIDHPTQCMADMAHCIREFGGVENLKGKKIAMTWAYSPSYGKPLSVPQGVIGLFTRFGMDVTLAHPEGYEVMDDVVEVAKRQSASAAASSPSPTACPMHLKARTSCIPRAGRRSRRWKSAQSSTAKAISTASSRWRRNCSSRTPSTRTGNAPKNSWPRPTRARRCICTACRPTSPA